MTKAPYTKAKMAKAFKDLVKVKEYQKQAQLKTGQLETVLKRIDWALEANFPQFLKDLEKAEKIKSAAILKEKDPEGYRYSNPKALATQRARAQIMRDAPYTMPHDNRWADFVHIATEQQKRDRVHYIKSGEIKA